MQFPFLIINKLKNIQSIESARNKVYNANRTFWFAKEQSKYIILWNEEEQRDEKEKPMGCCGTST